MDTLKTITDLLQDRLNLHGVQIRPELKLSELGIDSLALIELMFDVETALNIDLGNEQASLSTVQDVIHLVDAALVTRDKLHPQAS